MDNDFTDGLVLDHMLPNTDWTFDGKNNFTYNKILAKGESANFTVIFNTISIGEKVNNVTAVSNLTPEVNGTNKTFVTNNSITVDKISLNTTVLVVGDVVAF